MTKEDPWAVVFEEVIWNDADIEIMISIACPACKKEIDEQCVMLADGYTIRQHPHLRRISRYQEYSRKKTSTIVNRC